MKRVFGLAAVVSLFVTFDTVSADAAVFERDWKTPGDGLLTYDDVNRREWLDLSQSELSQFPYPFVEPALAELAPGRRFEGFQWATDDDVIALAESAGIDRLKYDSIDETTRLIELLGPSDVDLFEAQGIINHTLFDPIFSRPWPAATFAVLQNPFTAPHFAGLFFSSSYPALSTGLMLYRTVPEPSSLVLLATAWVIMRARHRWRPIHGIRRQQLWVRREFERSSTRPRQQRL